MHTNQHTLTHTYRNVWLLKDLRSRGYFQYNILRGSIMNCPKLRKNKEIKQAIEWVFVASQELEALNDCKHIGAKMLLDFLIHSYGCWVICVKLTIDISEQWNISVDPVEERWMVTAFERHWQKESWCDIRQRRKKKQTEEKFYSCSIRKTKLCFDFSICH